MAQNLTYSQIVDAFELACQQHVQIASFDSGTIDFLDASAQNRLYPYIFLRPMNSILADRTRTLTFELYSLDQPGLASQSNKDVISNTEQYIYDLMAWFNFGPTARQQTYDVSVTAIVPVNEAFQDRVFGWVATVDVNTPFNLDFCSYPTGSM